MTPGIRVEATGHLLRVWIDRPEVMNALDPPTSAAMSRVWDRYRDDDTLWAAVLAGTGERAFSVGFDLKWAQAHPEADLHALIGPGGFGGLTHRSDIDKPIVAAVRGYCLGGGLELALACDLIVVGASTRVGFPEPLRGNIAMWGGIQRLARWLPGPRLNRLLLAGEILDADTALAWGLVSRVVPDAQVEEAATALAEQVLTACPLAVRATKALTLEQSGRALDDALASASSHPLVRRLQASRDHAEGIAAFRERRDPVWTGR